MDEANDMRDLRCVSLSQLDPISFSAAPSILYTEHSANWCNNDFRKFCGGGAEAKASIRTDLVEVPYTSPQLRNPQVRSFSGPRQWPMSLNIRP